MKIKKQTKRTNAEKSGANQLISDEEAHRLAQRDIKQMERELKDPEAEISFTKEELDEVTSDVFGKIGKAKDSEPTDPYADDDEDYDDDDGISGLVGGAIGAVVGGIAGLIGGIALGSIINRDDDYEDSKEEEEEKECAE